MNRVSSVAGLDTGGANSGPINASGGTVAIGGSNTATLTAGGEPHSHAFTGTLPGTPVPEPPAAAVFGAGLTFPSAMRAQRLVQNGTPARFRLVRMVCRVCTRLTVGNPVSRCVS